MSDDLAMFEDISVSASVKKQFDLTDRVALITGGSGFLGMQYAEAVIEMGGIPIILDLKESYITDSLVKLRNSGAERCGGYKIDITNEDECKKIIQKILNKYEHIDILINNAALTKEGFEQSKADYFAGFEDTDQGLWEKTLKVNLTGVEIMCKLVGPIMSSQRKGSIINIASDVGFISPDHRIYQADEQGYQGVSFNTPASYAVSKAGVIQLTRYLATYWALHNVRVNAVSPAGVFRNHDPAFVKKLSECIPLGRMALPNEYKGAIVFLASDASSFMTGHNLVLDGGRSVW